MRVRTAREFKVWEGGGEYNTSRGLRKCFGLKTAVVTAFVDNEVGHRVDHRHEIEGQCGEIERIHIGFRQQAACGINGILNVCGCRGP